MTLQECYLALGGDYADAKNRFSSERLVEKFMLKFPQDDTMRQLREALSIGDYETAFRSAHSLKGLAANLSFTTLQASSSALTELLRGHPVAPDPQAVRQVEADYARVLDALKRYQAG